MNYKEWLSEVDKVLNQKIGLVTDDLNDWLSRDAYETGYTPIQAARMCLEEQKNYTKEQLDFLFKYELEQL